MRKFLTIIFLVLFTQVSLPGYAVAQDTVSVSKPVGYDVSNYVGAKRYRSQSQTRFVNERFTDNLFIALDGVVGAPRSSDYGFSASARMSMKKWWTPSLGARLSFGGGYTYSNFNDTKLKEFSASASVLFNLSSYVLGYSSARFCELSLVLGPGYSYCGNITPEHFFLIDLGLNVNLRLTRRLALNVEPGIPLRMNGNSFAYGFSTGVGLEYEFSENVSKPSGAGHFVVSTMTGFQFQNSVLARDMGIINSMGMHHAIAVGRQYSDYFSLRFSAVYSHDSWAEYYGGYEMPAKYYAFRVEGMLDVLKLLMHNHEDNRWGCGVVLGPQVGYMSKIDIESELEKHYVGLAYGLHGDYRVFDWLGVFVEPRFSIIPYTAPNSDSTSNNVCRNYYDSLFNFNVGLEIYL